jgi:valyl-tRNA synthetase
MGQKIKPDGPGDAGKSDLELSLEEVAFVAEDEAQLLEKVREYYGNPNAELSIHDTMESYLEWDSALTSGISDSRLHRDKIHLYREEDVLDTWFSSALWPFATLGWPDGKGGAVSTLIAQLATTPTTSSFPASTSSSSGMRAWRCRGCTSWGEVPWKTLYLHGLVRAADGQKMSKSKGNVVDPLILMDQYGADALRFFMAAMESQGRDVKMDERRVEGYRNFATKLWNAARFCQSNGIGASTTSMRAPEATLAVNKWIIGEVVETLAKLDKAFAELSFRCGMADTIYHFTWGTFCDWYLELIKPVFLPPQEGTVPSGEVAAGSTTARRWGNDSGPLRLTPCGHSPPEGENFEAAETRAVAGWVFDQILVMLHPFMPFITEELWHAIGWPHPPRKL